MLERFLNLQTGNIAVDQVFYRLKNVIDQIQNQPIVNGELIEGVVLTSGIQNRINHKLGRNITGYIVTLRSVDCRVWDDQATNTEKDKFLLLRTSATVTVSLWVF